MLTNPESIAAGIGPICGAGYGVMTWQEVEAKLANVPVVAKVWVPKSQIKESQINPATAL